MSWIKRNLYFFILSIMGLVLMGLAGWFSYSKWNLNNQMLTSLNEDYDKLKSLNSQNPHPGSGQVDNVKLAKEQRDQLLGFIRKSRDYYARIAPIPDEEKITDRDFSVSLSRTIAQLQREATNSSVIVQSNYAFSFEAQKAKVSFAAGSLGPLSTQLGEVSNLCTILFQAKINSLDNIRREKVSTDDSSGPQTDYLTDKSITNDLAVLTPYEVTFRCFSSELASVLSGFGSSPYGFIVKSFNVDPAPALPAAEQPVAPIVQYQYVQPQQAETGAAANPAMEAMMAQQRMMARYGLMGRGREGAAGQGGVQYRPLGSTPSPTYAPTAAQPGAAAGKGGLQTVLDEKQLKITVNLILVKLLPEKPTAAK
ncbi:MAG TPA: Amuc_1100 family pilus-like protein [Candidatus Limnocylindrales bacterium]|jgi:hypothetical protein|nr:Amuc_1100 family pilus-like protein [Candidatus Limnocylindrales bacterium]